MKTFAIATILNIAFLTPGFAQAPAPHHHSLSLEAQSVASGGTTKVSGGGTAKNEAMTMAYGGGPVQTEVSQVHEKRNSSSRTNVQVDIRNFGQAPDNIKLEWYFMAGPAGKGASSSKDYVFDHGEQAVSIPAGGSDSRVITSKEARTVQERSATVLGSGNVSFVGGGNARGSTKESGVVLRGWFVRLVDNGEVVATRGSSQAYEDIAKDEYRLNALPGSPTGHGKR